MAQTISLSAVVLRMQVAHVLDVNMRPRHDGFAGDGWNTAVWSGSNRTFTLVTGSTGNESLAPSTASNHPPSPPAPPTPPPFAARIFRERKCCPVILGDRQPECKLCPVLLPAQWVSASAAVIDIEQRSTVGIDLAVLQANEPMGTLIVSASSILRF